MEQLSELKQLVYAGTSELSFTLTVLSFVSAITLSFLVKNFYIRYSLSLTGKMHIGPIIPILTSVVFLVIVVVKSSLALSLGLVGALSIVRFRTPIKEPEELVYLFLAIAIGLGFGAGYILITTVITLFTLIVIYFLLSNKNIKTSEYNLVINWTDKNLSHETIIAVVEKLASSLKLVRLENSKDYNSSVLLIELATEVNLDFLVKQLKLLDNNVNVTFFENRTNW